MNPFSQTKPNLASKASLASPTFTGTPAAPTAADNTSTTQLATTAFAKSQDAVLARLPDQAVNMTYAASGGSGITVANNSNINFGTGNFTLVWRGSLPVWTLVGALLFYKQQDGSNEIAYYIDSNGKLAFSIVSSGATTLVKSVTNAHGLANSTFHEITMVRIAETASTNGSITFYIDGCLFETLSVSATATPASASNTGNAYILGSSVTRSSGTCSFAATFNRALSAAEVLDLYRNGISYADKWGNNTILNTTCVNSGILAFGTFSGASATGFRAIKSAASDCYANSPNIPWEAGKKYSISFTLSLSSGTLPKIWASDQDTGGVAAGMAMTDCVVGINYFEFTSTISIAGIVQWGAFANTDFTISNLAVKKIGATLALEPEGIQNDKWYDSSSNALNASYPAAGWSLARKLNVPRTNTGQPAFLAVPSSVQENIAVTTAVTVAFGTEIFDQGNNFSANTFTAPVTGKYLFSFELFVNSIDTGSAYYQPKIVTSNRIYYSQYYFSVLTSDAGSWSMVLTALADMDAGDTAHVEIYQSGGTQQSDIDTTSWFSGHLVC